MQQPVIFTGNRKGLFFPAAQGLAAFLRFFKRHFNNAVLAVAEPPAMLIQMIFFSAGAIAEVNDLGVGASITGKKQKKQHECFHLPGSCDKVKFWQLKFHLKISRIK